MQLPAAHVTRAVIERYGRIAQRYTRELGARPCVLPTAEYFPDRFEGDVPSLQRLLQRMQHLAGLGDVPMRAAVVSAPTPATGGSCSSGACGVPASAASGVPRLVDEDESWLLQVPEAELRHPVALTTNLARSLAFIFLVETQEEGELLEPPLDVTADLVAVALGFGALMLQGSYIYAKSCSGPSVASVTKLSVGELAVAYALFAAANEHPLRAALRELDVTQRAVLADAQALIDSNRPLVRLLKHRPDDVVLGKFELEEARGWLGRVFARRPRTTKSPASLAEVDASMSLEDLEDLLIDMPPASSAGRHPKPPPPTTNPEHDELKVLVTEALAAR